MAAPDPALWHRGGALLGPASCQEPRFGQQRARMLQEKSIPDTWGVDGPRRYVFASLHFS